MRSHKTLNKLWKIAAFAFKPSLTSAFLLVLGALAFSQYEDLVNHLAHHMKAEYFFEKRVFFSTLGWGLGVLVLGYLFSYTFILNAHLQNEALEKIKQLDSDNA